MVSCLGVGRIRGFRVEGEGSDTGVSCLGGEGEGGFVSVEQRVNGGKSEGRESNILHLVSLPVFSSTSCHCVT